MKLSTIAALSLVPFIPSVQAQGFYKNTDVFELDTTNFDKVVLDSNHTTIVEFYAPWCGHCRSLKKDYTKAAKHLKDIVQVAAVNCDYAKNKHICSKYKIEGYPTILGFRPPKINLEKSDPIKYGHATEKYVGARNTKGIVDFAIGRIKNYVKRIATEERLNEWLHDSKSARPKVVVFTRKDKLSPLLKSIAIDFLGIVDFAYFPLREREKNVYEKYQLEEKSSKAVVYFFDNDDEPVRHEGSLTKEDISQFLTKFDSTKEATGKVIKKQEYLGKVQKGEKIKKSGKSSSPNDHDEL